jgi:anti-repressor protein
MTKILNYDFHDHVVRIINRNGEPWFILADVCRVLGIKNSGNAANRLKAVEKEDIRLVGRR